MDLEEIKKKKTTAEIEQEKLQIAILEEMKKILGGN